MNPPDKPDKEVEHYGQVQKRRISWDEFERVTGLKRPEPAEPEPPPPAPEPPAPDPAVAFAALLDTLRDTPRQKAFGQLVRRRLAAMGMTQAKASPLVGFKNRGELGNALDARRRWPADRLRSLLAVLNTDAASMLEVLEHEKN